MNNKVCVDNAGYTLNPIMNSHKSKTVKPDITMYTLGIDGTCDNPFKIQAQRKLRQQECKDFRINPNLETLRPEEAEWMILPKSNVAIRKRDWLEKQKFTLHPEMFPQLPPNDVLEMTPAASLVGLDFPVPMRFQLNYLQDNVVNNDAVDYDMRLTDKCNDKILPKYYDEFMDSNFNYNNNVDFDFVRMPNLGIMTSPCSPYDPHGNRTSINRTKPKKPVESSCSQEARKLKQEQSIIQQPYDWYKFKNDSVYERTPNGCVKERNTERVLNPMDTTEIRVFKDEVDCRRPQYRTYPSQAAFKSSFFGLGPALPPPNPLLLSNVPSDLLQAGILSKDPNLRSIIDPDYINILKNTKVTTQDPDYVSSQKVETFTGELDLNASPDGTAQATPQSQFEIVRPSPTNGPEYSPRNASLETEIMDQVRYIDEQVIAILRQISDIRQQIPELKQRELTAKETSNLPDINVSISTYQQSIELLNKLRRVLTRIQTKRKHLVDRLKLMMPSDDYKKWYNEMANKASLAEVVLKQYHAQAPDDGIIAYGKRNFDGDGFEMKEGFYDYPYVGGVGNNSLQSIKVGKDVSVVMYERSQKRGQVLVYHGPRRIPVMPTLWYNRVSGIEVVKKIRVSVTVFDAPFFQGKTVKLVPGMYDYPDVGGMGVNKLNSIVIPNGFQVTLYSVPKKKGERITYLGPQRLSFLPADWARKVQGIEVVLKDS